MVHCSHAKFGDVNYDNKEDCDWIVESPQVMNMLGIEPRAFLGHESAGLSRPCPSQGTE